MLDKIISSRSTSKSKSNPVGHQLSATYKADDASEGYMIHVLNTVHIKDLNKWIRLDARGNKENINAYFSLDEEHLAYSIRSEFGELIMIIMLIWMKGWLIY